MNSHYNYILRDRDNTNCSNMIPNIRVPNIRDIPTTNSHWDNRRNNVRLQYSLPVTLNRHLLSNRPCESPSSHIIGKCFENIIGIFICPIGRFFIIRNE